MIHMSKRSRARALEIESRIFGEDFIEETFLAGEEREMWA